MIKNKHILKFYIDFPGEFMAGLHAFNNEIVIEILSGKPGGEPRGFESYIKKCLSEWYDGAGVFTDNEWKKRLEAEQEFLWEGKE